MSATWHALCNRACTCTTLDYPEFQFACCISSLTCAADRSGGGVPSHLRQTPFNNRKHTTTRRRAGAGHNRVMGLTRCDASLPVYGQGRDHVVAVWNGRGFSLTALFPDTQTTNCGRCFGIGRLFEQYGVGERSTAPQAKVDHSLCARTFQSLAKGNSHFEFSRLNATNLFRGGHDEIHETPTFGTADDR